MSNFEYSALSSHEGVVDEVHQRLFLPGYSRVWVFDATKIADGMKAMHWLGHSGELYGAPEKTTASEMVQAGSAAYDRVNNRLFVIDHERVLVFDAANIKDGMPAFGVIGQPDFTSSQEYTHLQDFGFPSGLAYDSKRQRLFVACSERAHVLVYDVSNLTLGLAPSFVLGKKEAPGKMESPRMMTPEEYNPGFWSRIKMFVASVVSSITEKFAPSGRWRISYPYGLAFDEQHDRLFVTDRNAHRVLVFNAAKIENGMNADAVLGQPNFGAYAEPRRVSDANLRIPASVVYDSKQDRIFVSDVGRNRVLVFDTKKIENGQKAVAVLGPMDNESFGKLTFDPIGNRLIVGANEKLLIYDATNISADMKPSIVVHAKHRK